ncbi:hypothetical protein C8R45DRAFT_934142 [Mycena sanguinolenta]|nr:hypothetical protein C8R45DRAFT_934142 [Mycena sanguinolenta]
MSTKPKISEKKNRGKLGVHARTYNGSHPNVWVTETALVLFDESLNPLGSMITCTTIPRWLSRFWDHDFVGTYPGTVNLAIPVTPTAIEELRAMIETPREEAFHWVSDEFNVLATQVCEELGSPKMEALTGWAIFNAMAPLIRSQVDYEILM